MEKSPHVWCVYFCFCLCSTVVFLCNVSRKLSITQHHVAFQTPVVLRQAENVQSSVCPPHASLMVLCHCVLQEFPHFVFVSLLGFLIILVVELNCEVHIAHNLKIKLLKVKRGPFHSFSTGASVGSLGARIVEASASGRGVATSCCEPSSDVFRRSCGTSNYWS